MSCASYNIIPFRFLRACLRCERTVASDMPSSIAISPHVDPSYVRAATLHCIGGRARSRRRTCCCSSVKMLRLGSAVLSGTGSLNGAVCGRALTILQYARTATVRTQASGLSMDSHLCHARIIASCVASSASARLAPIVISRTTVLPNRSRKNETKPLSVNYR